MKCEQGVQQWHREFLYNQSSVDCDLSELASSLIVLFFYLFVESIHDFISHCKDSLYIDYRVLIF